MRKMVCIPALGLLLLSGLFACQSEKSEAELPPAGLVPRDSLRAFLLDLHELEAALNQSGIRQDSATALFSVMENDLYRRHALDSGRVGLSLRYYCRNPEKLDSLYDGMEASPSDPAKEKRLP